MKNQTNKLEPALSENRWVEGQSVNGRKNKPRDIITENTARCPRDYCSLPSGILLAGNSTLIPGKFCGLPQVKIAACLGRKKSHLSAQKEPLI